MTRDGQIAIAGLIRDLPYDRLVVAERFAAMLAKDDPDFDRNRFLAAALWGSGYGGRGAALPMSNAKSADASRCSANRARKLMVRRLLR